MKVDQHRFLSLLGQLPARVTAEQAAWMLNCQAHDLPVLVASRLLKPLGNPPANGVKFFCADDILEASKDRTWLVKVTVAISGHWQKQNARKKLRTIVPNSPALFDRLQAESPLETSRAK